MTDSSLYSLIWMSRPLMQAAEASVEAGLSGTGLTVRMRAVLEMLHAHGDQTVPEIAQRLEIKRQYVQLMVNETGAAGLTEPRANPRHKRSPLLSLTETGRALIDGVIARERALVDRIGADLDPTEVAAALRIVQTLTTRLKSHAKDRP
ncbi:MarR family winged helix-turn-helix transcriptional regulator [Dinoroseobacter sp. S375]|uniref:MarR family winged helix-turn-helix transcriptional regulator n=1 Tax=Dinoroseobacter sp. S375 TaxID=3415136 RepID=UPI003C7B429E